MHLDIEKLFTYHAPYGDQVARYQALREQALAFAEEIELRCPASAERTLAIRRLQEAVMWANASIAINEAP